MQHKKYEPHIRLPFRIFDDPQFRTIPKSYRSSCLAILVCLLKFTNSKTRQCYPRVATISSMIGMGRTTIFRCLAYLQRAGIITRKRLTSSVLYTIQPQYIVGVQNTNTPVPYMNTPSSNYEHINKTNSNITNIINKVVEQGDVSNTNIVKALSSLPLAELEYGHKNNDNPYLCKLAIDYKKEQNTNYVDTDVINKTLQNVTKRTNYFYKNKVEENKKKNARISATKDFLSSVKKKG